MRYALIKFWVHLLGERTFALYTDHESLRTAMKSPHLSQRMARWLFFFFEYNFVMHYKPGKTNILADALSRRPNYDPRYAWSRQEVDDDEDDDRCAKCISLNLARFSPSRACSTKSSRLIPVVHIMLTSLHICVLPATLHWKLYRGASAITSSSILWTETRSYTASINSMTLAL